MDKKKKRTGMVWLTYKAIDLKRNNTTIDPSFSEI